MPNDNENQRTESAASLSAGFPYEKPTATSWRGFLVWQGLPFQLTILAGCWCYMVGLHWHSDGLFFQGDSPRHAMNGVFWGDLLREGWSDPYGYTKSYYARYPAISPTRYPPMFYFLEAAAFEIMGVSAFVAKGLVQAFALAMGVYLLAAMRRWISHGSGVFAGLLFLMPGMVTWSNAVMLNVPAATLSWIGLSYVRRGVESQSDATAIKFLLLAQCFLMLSLGTHPTVGYAIPVMVAWVAARGKLHLFRHRSMIIVFVISTTLLVVVAVCVWIFASEQLSQASVSASKLYQPKRWWFYVAALPSLASWYGCLAGLLCIILAWTCPKLRLEVKLLVIAFAIGYFVLTPMWALDARYALLACPALTYAIGLGFTTLDSRLKERSWRPRTAVLYLLGFLGLGLGCVLSNGSRIPANTTALEPVAEYVESIAHHEAVLYDGRFDGVFIFYMRLRDNGFSRQIVLTRKLIDRNASKKQLREALFETGCRWLVLEKTASERPRGHEKDMQKLVREGGFELVKTFESLPKAIERLEVYKLNASTDEQDVAGASSVDVRILGDLVSPVTRRD